jgi:hypothetical protein
MCALSIIIAVIITLLVVAIALIALAVAAVRKLISAVKGLFTWSSKSGFAAAPDGPDGPSAPVTPSAPDGYSGDLCMNYCDPRRGACSKSCLKFDATGPVFK